MANTVLLLGAGKIGRMISRFLVDSGDFEVLVADHDEAALERIQELADVNTRIIDANDSEQLLSAMQGRNIVISALSFRFNPGIAQACLESGASYFDLTEDVETTRKGQACGSRGRKKPNIHATMWTCTGIHFDCRE